MHTAAKDLPLLSFAKIEKMKLIPEQRHTYQKVVVSRNVLIHASFEIMRKEMNRCST